MKPAKPIVPLIYRTAGLLVSTTGILLHLESKHFVQAGFMIRHNLAYYTIETNIWAALLFAALLIRTLVLRKRQGRWTTAHLSPGLQGAAAFYITMTMLGFWLLLAPTTGLGKNPYLLVSSLILHTVTPLLTLGDFLFFCPHGHLTRRHAALWLIYPALYLGMVMICSRFLTQPYYSFQMGGRTVDLMVPYPFLDPSVLGPWGVAAAVILLAAVFYGLGLLFVFLDRRAAASGSAVLS